MVRLVGLFKPQPAGSADEQVYQNQCSDCHGANRMGSPGEIPSLVDIDTRLTDKEIADTVHGGKGCMPGFSLSDEQTQTLLRAGCINGYGLERVTYG
jgi:quinoprotein glucose dehydrogenase